jgi:hypothetical protein
MIGIELQMVSTKAAVHIGGPDFMAVHPAFGNQPIEAIEEHLLPSAKAALDELVWWARATMAAKDAEAGGRASIRPCLTASAWGGSPSAVGSCNLRKGLGPRPNP